MNFLKANAIGFISIFLGVCVYAFHAGTLKNQIDTQTVELRRVEVQMVREGLEGAPYGKETRWMVEAQSREVARMEAEIKGIAELRTQIQLIAASVQRIEKALNTTERTGNFANKD